MRAWTPTGRPTEPLALTNVAEPAPAEDEAVVTVEAYSVNRGETIILEAGRARWRPGKDVAGTVVAAARDGSGSGPRWSGIPSRPAGPSGPRCPPTR